MTPRLPPPTFEYLNGEVLEQAPGRVRCLFRPTEEMTNPWGAVQGGILAAFFDDTMGPALVSMTGGAEVPASIDINVSFLKPVMPGRVIGKGRVVGRGRSVAFLEAELFDESGELLARATSSARIMELNRNAS